jgi:hypothetical protein
MALLRHEINRIEKNEVSGMKTIYLKEQLRKKMV